MYRYPALSSTTDDGPYTIAAVAVPPSPPHVAGVSGIPGFPLPATVVMTAVAAEIMRTRWLNCKARRVCGRHGVCMWWRAQQGGPRDASGGVGANGPPTPIVGPHDLNK